MVAFEAPQVTVNGPHCVGTEYTGAKAAVGGRAEKRTRARDSVWRWRPARERSMSNKEASRASCPAGCGRVLVERRKGGEAERRKGGASCQRFLLDVEALRGAREREYFRTIK